MASTVATARKNAPTAATPSSMDEAGIDALMRELIHGKPSESGIDIVGAIDAGSVQPGLRRDFDMATGLLDRAGQAFDLLIDRCQALEHDLDDANERARAREAEQEEAVEQWKRLAAKLKAQLETTEQAMASLRVRCDTVQARAVKAEQAVRVLEMASTQATAHAALAEQLSTKLHDKVVAAFGIGSRAHPVLEAVATKAADE